MSLSLFEHLNGCLQYFWTPTFEVCGLFDENFRNSGEHIVHTLKYSNAGFIGPWTLAFPGISDSEKYVKYLSSLDDTTCKEKLIFKTRSFNEELQMKLDIAGAEEPKLENQVINKMLDRIKRIESYGKT